MHDKSEMVQSDTTETPDTVDTESDALDDALLDNIFHGDLSYIDSYLEIGGSPDKKIEIGGRERSLLRIALYARDEDIALSLLDAGADLTAELEAYHIYPYEFGKEGMNRVLERLLSGYLDNIGIANIGTSVAAINGYYDTVEVYLRYATSRKDEWAIEFSRAADSAMVGGYDDVARLLLDSGADLNHLQHVSLYVAARFSSPGMVRYLLRRGANPNERLPEEEIVQNVATPMDFAWRRYQEEQEYYGILEEEGHPAIDLLKKHDTEYILFELMREGAVLEGVDLSNIARDGMAELDQYQGAEKLIAAARMGFIDVVEQLLTDNAYEFTQQYLREAVIVALEKNHDDISRLLLQAGAPPDGGPLHIAAAASSPGMVRYLLHLGADPEEIFRDKTPLQYWLTMNNSKFYYLTTNDPGRILHEMIEGGADVCWLIDYQDQLAFDSLDFFKASAPECWPKGEGIMAEIQNQRN